MTNIKIYLENSSVIHNSFIGGYVLQYQINLDPNLLRVYNIGIGQVYSAVASNNANVGAKVLEQNGQEWVIRGLGLVKTLEDIKNIVITQNNNVPVTVQDVARVELGPDSRRGVLTKFGNEAVGGIVIQQANENTLKVIDRVKEKIAEIQTSLPAGMKIVPFYEQTGVVKRAVSTLTEALIEEFTVVFLVVLLFMGNMRSSIIVTSAIPIGILIAFILMKGINLSANLMSLGGIAILQTAIKYRKLTIGFAMVMMLASFSLIPFIGTEFMPRLEEGSILVMPTMLPSVSLTEATEAAKKMDQLIMEIPEVEMSVGKVGRANSAMDPAPISMIETIVTLKPKEEWRPGYTQTDIELDMMGKLANMPGLNLAFTQPIAGRLAMLTTGIRTELGIKIFGDDINVLQKKALEIEKILSAVPGGSDLLAERILGAPYLEMHIDREKVARYGLNISDVEDAIELAIGGRSATTTIEGKKRVDILVRFNRDSRETIDAMKNIPIPVTSGGAKTDAGGGGMEGMGGGAAVSVAVSPGAHIPLGEVAEFRVVDGPSMISSENGMYRALVQLNTRDRDIGSYVEEADKLIKEQVEFPPGFYYKWSGQYENQERAKARLALVIPAVILLTFMLLFMSFSTVKGAVMILLNVPFSLVGGIASVFLTGTSFNVAVAVGFIALFGIAVQDGVMMLDRITELSKEKLVNDAVIEGAMERFRPVIMTCTVAGIGLLPLLFSGGAGAEIQRPMALVIVGGLVSSTFLTLILLPTIFYAWHNKSPEVTTDSKTLGN